MGAASHRGSELNDRLHNRKPPRLMQATQAVRQFTLDLMIEGAGLPVALERTCDRRLGRAPGFVITAPGGPVDVDRTYVYVPQGIRELRPQHRHDPFAPLIPTQRRVMILSAHELILLTAPALPNNL
jgi:hypothetical protein